jgi:hypothetical protein
MAMPRKRLPPKEPVDGILRTTNAHPTSEDHYTSVLFNCGRCRQRLPDLIRYDADGISDLWIKSDIAGPLWRWDGAILRPTRTHLDERHRRHELARTTTQVGLKKRAQKSLTFFDPLTVDALPLPRHVKFWRRPQRRGPLQNPFEIRIEPAPERIECPECHAEVRAPCQRRAM